jgi:phenylacetate-CoA ligase
VNLWPAAVEAVVRRFADVAEHTATLGSRDQMTEVAVTIEPVPDAGDPNQLARDVAGALQTALGLRIPVTLAAPGTLPRYEFKARRWLRPASPPGA